MDVGAFLVILALSLLMMLLGLGLKAAVFPIIAAVFSIIGALTVQVDGGLSNSYHVCVATNSTVATCVDNVVLIPSTQIVGLIFAVLAVLQVLIAWKMFGMD